MEATREVILGTSSKEARTLGPDAERITQQSEFSSESDDEASTHSAIFRLLLHSLGLDTAAYRIAKTGKHITEQLAIERAGSLERYLELLRRDADEIDILHARLFRGNQAFFGDVESHQVISRSVMPDLMKKIGTDQDIRIWVVGCGSGHEPYAIAMLLRDALIAENKTNKVRIFATDVHAKSLAGATAGIYSAESIAAVSETWRNRYFSRVAEGFQVSPDIRGMVTFAKHNILQDPPLLNLDFVVCRNLLTYLQPTAQKRVLSLFHVGLKSGGVLFLGPSESITQREDAFEPLDLTGHTFRNSRTSASATAGNVRSGLGNVQPHQSASLGRRIVPDRQLVTILDSILSAYIPSGFLVGEGRELLYCFGKGADLLSLKKGRMSAAILNLLPPELRSILAGALSSVKETGEALRFERVPVTIAEGKSEELTVTVQPFMMPGAIAPCVLVTTEEICETKSKHASKEDEKRAQTLSGLKEELSYTGETLLRTIEEFEAANEQLQVTSHELQVAQEELCSVTEELNTVNADYQAKLGELAQLGNDLENLLAGGEIAVLFLDSSLCIRRFSAAIAELLDLSVQDIGRPFDSLGSRFHGPALTLELERVVREGVCGQWEYDDGSGRLFLVKLRPYRVRDVIDGVVISMDEVTALRKSEREACRCGARYTALVESIDGAVWRMDEVGAIQEVEPTWGGVTGQSWSEQRGFGWVLAIDEGDRALVVEQLSHEPVDTREEGTPLSVRVWSARHKEHRICSLRFSSLVEPSSGERSWIGTIVDNHEVHRTEELLGEAKMVRQLIDDSLLGVAVQDRFGRYRWVNGRYAELHHLSADQIEGKTDYDLFPLEVAETFRSRHVEVVQGGQLREYEESLLPPGNKGGPLGTLLVARYPMRLPNGGGDGVATVSLDITERKKIEQQALEAVRLRDSFMATIAHEIRNPLHAILSAIAVFQTAGTSDEVHTRALAVIARQSQQVSRLVDDLMTMTRSQQDKLRLNCRMIDLRPTIESAIDQVKLDLDAKHQQLLLEMPEEPVRVWGDDDRLRQLVANLVDNASKYSPDRTHIRICISREGVNASISIRDEGRGISPDQIGRVFQKYAQVDGVAPGGSQGVGLGLWVVQEIAIQHGGSVVARSEGAGRGSEFVVTIPLLEKDLAAGHVAPGLSPNGPGERILLVEDNADASEMLRMILTAKGFDVDIASSGQEALDQVHEHCPVAALVDIGLPDMSGLDVVRRLRAEHPDHLPMMIAVSGYGEEEDKQAARDAGFDAYLTKPIRVEDVVALLH